MINTLIALLIVLMIVNTFNYYFLLKRKYIEWKIGKNIKDWFLKADIFISAFLLTFIYN